MIRLRTVQRLGALALGAAAAGAVMTACTPLVVGGAATTAALVATDRRTSGAQLDDQGIELRAGNAIRDEVGTRARVDVVSYNRHVLLVGEVASQRDKEKVEAVVAGVPNVRRIFNELAVMSTPAFKERANDALLTGKVKAAIVDARDINAAAFKVVTERSTVYLMGLVTNAEAERATEVTRNVQGVQRVVRLFEIVNNETALKLQAKEPPEPPSHAR
ncbi:BON domain-containing protein [Hydrogenophaga sp. 5NK40-0174]|uniref:BON domain-containing protein n=1 Tax=Hydrogenophaga sp. 5NK40-0174 TaxID=3127649 RepID=UPI00310C6B12